MKPFRTSSIDPSEPLYDGEARMNAAFAVLTASSHAPAHVPTVQAKVPTATRNTTRHARGFHMGGQQVARRSLRPDRRISGATRYFQPSSRVMHKFQDSVSPRAQQRDTRMGTALLMAAGRRVRGPVINRAQELDRVRSRANAQAVVNTLRYRWNVVNRLDLSDGVANANHLRKHARNYNRSNKPASPVMVAALMFG